MALRGSKVLFCSVLCFLVKWSQTHLVPDLGWLQGEELIGNSHPSQRTTNTAHTPVAGQQSVQSDMALRVQEEKLGAGVGEKGKEGGRRGKGEESGNTLWDCPNPHTLSSRIFILHTLGFCLALHSSQATIQKQNTGSMVCLLLLSTNWFCFDFLSG